MGTTCKVMMLTTYFLCFKSGTGTCQVCRNTHTLAYSHGPHTCTGPDTDILKGEAAVVSICASSIANLLDVLSSRAASQGKDPSSSNTEERDLIFATHRFRGLFDSD